MAVTVKTRNPSFSVTIATQNGTFINPSDIADSLVEINTSRRMGDAGTFQIVLLFRPPAAKFRRQFLVETWADLVAPMDYVQIELVDTYKRETVMRGFIDTVGFTIDNSSGMPTQRVVIVGRDYTKIFLTHQLYFPSDPKAPTTQLAIMQKIVQGLAALNGRGSQTLVVAGTAGPVEKINSEPNGYRATEILNIFFQFFLQPEMADVLSTFQGLTAAPNLIFQPDGINIDLLDSNLICLNPIVSSTNLEPFRLLGELFRDYQHSPWRELFFDDYGANTYLFYRPAPWLNLAGDFIQFRANNRGMISLPDPWDISLDDVLNLSLGRNDAQVANFISTYSGIFAGYTEAMDTYGSVLESLNVAVGPDGSGNPSIIGINDVPPFNETPSSIHRFGFRHTPWRTPYFDLSDLVGKSVSATVEKVASLRSICADWNNRITQATNHDELLESGSLSMKGDVRIHIGHYVRFALSPQRQAARYYVEGVNHLFRFPTSGGGGGFFTTLELTRGRGFMAAHGYKP